MHTALLIIFLFKDNEFKKTYNQFDKSSQHVKL